MTVYSRTVQICRSSAVSVFQNFGEKWSYYYWRFPRLILLSKVSAKYCSRVINTAIALTWTRSGKRQMTKLGVGNLFTITGRMNCALSLEGRKN